MDNRPRVSAVHSLPVVSAIGSCCFYALYYFITVPVAQINDDDDDNTMMMGLHETLSNLQVAGRERQTGDLDGGSAVDFAGDVLSDALVDALIHVDRVLNVERPVVEALAHRLDAVRPGYGTPVLLELHARVWNAEHATLQLAVLVQVEHLVFERLQECWRICAERSLL